MSICPTEEHFDRVRDNNQMNSLYTCPLLTANLVPATPDTMFALENKALQHSLELMDVCAPLRAQPKLDNACIDREADPERDAEELAGAEMRS
jgi:hypothetical protein